VSTADGGLLWEHPVTRGCTFDPAHAPAAGLAEMRQSSAAVHDPWPDCSYFYAHSAAAVLANGIVYAGALDGRLRALSADDGTNRVFETARAFTGSNGIDGHGSSMDGAASTVITCSSCRVTACSGRCRVICCRLRTATQKDPVDGRSMR
jgi:outer membrane protein assembly factor BamB